MFAWFLAIYVVIVACLSVTGMLLFSWALDPLPCQVNALHPINSPFLLIPIAAPASVEGL